MLDDGVLRAAADRRGRAQAAAGLRRRVRPRDLRGRLPRDHRLVRGPRRPDLRDHAARRVDASGSPPATTCSRSSARWLEEGAHGRAAAGRSGRRSRAGSPIPSFARDHDRPARRHPRVGVLEPRVRPARRSRNAFDRTAATSSRLLREPRVPARRLLRGARARLPLHLAAQVDGLLDLLGSRRPHPHQGIACRPAVRVARRSRSSRGSSASTPPRGTADASSSSCRTPTSSILDRVEARAARPRSRQRTARRTRSRARSTFASSVLELASAPAASAPRSASRRSCSGGRRQLLEAFLEGLVDGDGSIDDTRTSVWTTSEGLVADLLVLFAPPRATCWHVLARPRPCADLPGLRADA